MKLKTEIKVLTLSFENNCIDLFLTKEDGKKIKYSLKYIGHISNIKDKLCLIYNYYEKGERNYFGTNSFVKELDISLKNFIEKSELKEYKDEKECSKFLYYKDEYQEGLINIKHIFNFFERKGLVGLVNNKKELKGKTTIVNIGLYNEDIDNLLKVSLFNVNSKDLYEMIKDIKE